MAGKENKIENATPLANQDTPKRRTSGRRKRKSTPAEQASAINPAYYVGYVEELETVDMIMKKFEALEKIQQQMSKQTDDTEIETEAPASTTKAADTESNDDSCKVPAAPVSGLSEQDLEKVFRATSTFTVEAVAKEAAADQNTYSEEGFDGYDEYDADGWGWGGVRTLEHEGEDVYFFGDGTDDGLWDEIMGSRKARRPRSSGSTRGNGNRNNRGVTQIAFVSDMRGQYVTGLKKVRYVDPNAICYQRIPADPLPLSWAKIIKPYVPHSKRQQVHTLWKAGDVVHQVDTHVFGGDPINDESVVVPNILQCDLVKLGLGRGKFRGIFLDPPWREPTKLPDSLKSPHDSEGSYEGDGRVCPEDLLKLKLEKQELLESGFVFIWAPKHLIARILSVLDKMNFHYVENAVYVKHNVDNSLASTDSKYLRQSKETLLVCRRGTRNPNNGKIAWKPVEIRHQRTSDVYSDFLRFGTENEKKGGNKGKHDDILPSSYVHNMIETMLPHGRYNNQDEPKAEQPESNHGQLLHVWATKGLRRSGWVTLSEER